jgi:hypothetical protein
MIPHPRYWLSKPKPKPLFSPPEYVPYDERKGAKALLYLAQEEHAIRCTRAYVRRCIEQAAPLGRIGQ